MGRGGHRFDPGHPDSSGYGLVVEREISNLSAGVRFPLPAPMAEPTNIDSSWLEDLDPQPQSEVTWIGKFDILDDESERKRILARGRELCELAQSDPTQRILFIGDESIPLVALFEQEWSQLFPGQETPVINILNLGHEEVATVNNYYRQQTGQTTVNTAKTFSLLDEPENITKIWGTAQIESLQYVWGRHESSKVLVVDISGRDPQTRNLIEKTSRGINPHSATHFFDFFTKADARYVTPWEEKFPRLDPKELIRTETDFGTSQAPQAHKNIILQACVEMRKLVNPDAPNTEPNPLIRQYLGV